MLYFRIVWVKIILFLFVLLGIAKIILIPLSKLMIWISIMPELAIMNCSSKLMTASAKLSGFSIDLINLVIVLLFLIGITLAIWLIMDVFNGQLKLDYYSVQLGKHLQRSQTNNLQMVKSEQEKANYWLKKLRIVKWKHRLYVLIPCGPNAAVEDVIKERCDNYTIGWLNLTIKNTTWINKINKYNRLHFN